MNPSNQSPVAPDSIRTLIISNDHSEAVKIESVLARETAPQFLVHLAKSAEAGITVLQRGAVDVVLLSMSADGDRSGEALKLLSDRFPDVPVVVLKSKADEKTGTDALRQGAMDYLDKEGLDSRICSRVIRYAYERQHLREEIKSLALFDGLTRLYNRRGLEILAEQQLKLARRRKKGLLLILADINGLGKINDQFGYEQGDMTLVSMSKLIKGTFRESDIMARIEASAFAVLAVEAEYENAERILERLRGNLRNFNAQERSPFQVSLTTGVACYDYHHVTAFEQLLEQGTGDLAVNKQSRLKI
ncbi:MAG: diguanylate cyclase [Candidatus Omnitrophota bacterium]|nr:diguanylate cyclase [Candidatus Omnitrophota bacterium]